MKWVRKIIFTLFTLMPLSWAASVFAAFVAPAPPTSVISTGGWSSVIDTINTARNWIFGIFLAIVVVYILIAAFNFLLSGGDDTKVKRAKTMMKNAVTALVIGLLAVSIIYVVSAFFDAVSSNSNNSSNLCKTDADCAKIISNCATQTCKCNADGSCTIY